MVTAKIKPSNLLEEIHKLIISNIDKKNLKPQTKKHMANLLRYVAMFEQQQCLFPKKLIPCFKFSLILWMNIRHSTKFNFSINLASFLSLGSWHFVPNLNLTFQLHVLKGFEQFLLLYLSHLLFFSQDGAVKANNFLLNN